MGDRGPDEVAMATETGSRPKSVVWVSKNTVRGPRKEAKKS